MNSINGNKITITISSNTSFIIPSNCAIAAVCIKNTTANAVTGGIKIGTTNGGTEVLAATPIGANYIDLIETTLGKRFYSTTADTTLYIQAVTAWNSANLEVNICLIYLG